MKTLEQLKADNPDFEAICFFGYQSGYDHGLTVEKQRQIAEAENQAESFFLSLPQQPVTRPKQLTNATK